LTRRLRKLHSVSIHVDVQHIMVPNQAPPTSTTTTGPLPPLTRSTTLPLPPVTARSVATDRSLLTPEDAIYQGSPPRKQSAALQKLPKDLRMTNGVNGDAARLPRRGRHKDRNRSGSRRKGTWKKLLWVKQSCRHI
jgi:phosphatidylinositol glycan class C protein